MMSGVSISRNPVAYFLVIGFVLLGGLVGLSQLLVMRAAQAEVITDARVLTEVLAHSVAEPAVPSRMVAGDAGAIDRFDRRVRDRLLVGDVRRIKIWDARGTVIYSDETELIGQQFDLDPEQAAVLRSGRTDGSLSDLRRQENRFEEGADGLVEVYTLIHAPEGDPLLFEAYFSADGIAAHAAEVLRPFRTVTVGILVAAMAVATAMLWGLTRRLTAAAQERERLLQAAVDASDAERRRIARDLHDGVVQDLAGTAFRLSALSREPVPPATAPLEQAASSLRDALRSLRSLMVEIHPPDLTAQGLAAALEDLTAPATAAGVSATVRVDGAQHLADDQTRLVWRVAQEAVRNALRHAAASAIDVSVVATAAGVRLTVTDDGRGFTPARRSTDGFGLRGVASLVSDSGGTIEVDSAPGRGTRLVLELGAS